MADLEQSRSLSLTLRGSLQNPESEEVLDKTLEGVPVDDPTDYDLPILADRQRFRKGKEFRSVGSFQNFAVPNRIGHGWGSDLDALFAGTGDHAAARDLYSLNRSNGSLDFYARKHTGAFSESIRVGTGWQVMRETVGGVDFTGDYVDDVLSINPKGELLLYKGIGKGRLSLLKVIGTSGWENMIHLLPVSKWGAYGATVIAVRNDGVLFAYPTDGKGAIIGRKQIGHGWQMMSEVFSVKDWSGDTRPDIFGVGHDGRLYFYSIDQSGYVSGHGQVGHGWSGFRSIIGAETVNGNAAIWAIDTRGQLWEYPQGGSALDDAIVAIAKNYLGIPYVYGGEDRRGMDCSGLVSVVYRDAGKPFNNGWRQDTSGIRNQSRVISESDARPGDILFWSFPDQHVAIYLGGGKMVDAATEGTLTAVRSIYPNPTYLRYGR